MQPECRDREPSPASSSFAGLLASLTSGRSQHGGSGSSPRRSWTDDLEDDVATLSYERALAHHARSRPEAIGSGSLTSGVHAHIPAAAGLFQPEDASAAVAQTETDRAEGRAERAMQCENRLEQSRKRASVTVRLTEGEYAQLQERATEAGMTVSGYLRSCTFEAESLRAQVKQTLAELRAASPAQVAAPAERTFRLRWFGFLRSRA